MKPKLPRTPLPRQRCEAFRVKTKIAWRKRKHKKTLSD